MKIKKVLSFTLIITFILLSVCPTYASNIKVGDKVTVGGMPFGIKFFSGTMCINGFIDVDTQNGNFSPAYQSGMRINDVIIKLNNKEVNTAEEVIREVENCDGKNLTFLCNRDSNCIICFSYIGRACSAGVV